MATPLSWTEQFVSACDVEDCFLNTPRELVIPTLRFWTEFRLKLGRPARFFAISKDSKNKDYLGRPCSTHFWELSSDTVIASGEWELEHNAFFEVRGEENGSVVLKQEKGLRVGGHLSAARRIGWVAPRTIAARSCVPLEYIECPLPRQLFSCYFAGNECLMNETAAKKKPVGSASRARFLKHSFPSMRAALAAPQAFGQIPTTRANIAMSIRGRQRLTHGLKCFSQRWWRV